MSLSDIKEFIVGRMVVPLLCSTSEEGNNVLSLGRLSFVVVLLISLYHYSEFDAYWLTLLMTLLGYVLSGKFIPFSFGGRATGTVCGDSFDTANKADGITGDESGSEVGPL